MTIVPTNRARLPTRLRLSGRRRRGLLGIAGDYYQIGRLVGVKRDRPHVLVVARLVEVDRRAGLIDVKHLPVRTRSHRHARPPLEISLHDVVLFEIEGPELVAADLLQQTVGALSIRCEREADRPRADWQR